jgi:3-hexulose-6-phosphate synthase
LLQLALDFTDRRIAFKIAEQCRPYVDILEAGTPLIKSEGIQIIKELRQLGLPVFADLKTFDAGGLEARMAAEYEADYATVLALANDTTVKNFTMECRKNGVKVVADLMNAPQSRALFLEREGVNYIAVHSGIDEQQKGHTPFNALRRVRRIVRTPLIAAGGINENSLNLVKSFSEIVVVGSAITHSKDPRGTARRINTIYREGEYKTLQRLI